MENNMTTIPTELADAREARTQAWAEYMLVIEREHTSTEFHQALHKAGQADKVCSDLYARWQAVGGTSDIESIVVAEKFLNLVEVCLTDPATIAVTPQIVDGVSSAAWWDAVKEVPYGINE
jgi:hypothetical protein